MVEKGHGGKRPWWKKAMVEKGHGGKRPWWKKAMVEKGHGGKIRNDHDAQY